MGSARNYWPIRDLLDDYRRHINSPYLPAREKAHASWQFLLKRWNIRDVDEAAMDEIEGYRPKPYKNPYYR